MKYSRYLKQKAVYWESLGLDDFGKPLFKEPVEIDVRWEEVNELFINSSGEQERSKAKVFVKDELSERGVLFLGLLSTLTAEQKADPFILKSAYSIKSRKSIPSLSGSEFVRTIWL